MNVLTAQVTPARVSVLIVDDARVTLEILRRTLKQAGYEDIRVATSGQDALDQLQDRPANLLLADWLMPGMDGLELTRRVRQLDEDNNQYTYIVLLTGREGSDSLSTAFAGGVDDFVNKSPDNTELLLRLHAAGRVAALQNELLQANQRLLELNRLLGTQNSFDLHTGLGNRQYLEQALGKLLRHVEGRGGLACIAVVSLTDLPRLQESHGDGVLDDLVEITAVRLQQSVRPLDTVGRLDEHQFAMLMHVDDPDQCHPNAFKRVHEALNLRAFKTRQGFINVRCAMSICGIPQKDITSTLQPGTLLDMAQSGIPEAELSGRVHQVRWQRPG